VRIHEKGLTHLGEKRAGTQIGTWLQRHRDWLVLALLWLFHAVNNSLWHSANVTMLGSDRVAHLLQSLAYYQALNPLSLDSISQIITYHTFYPPLFHLSVALFYSLFGVSADAAAMANLIYMAVLLFAVYGIGKRMFDAKVGLLAAFLVSILPIVFCLSRYTYVEYAFMSMTALSVYLLIRTDDFQNKTYSVLFGLSVGLGMLTKWVFIFFLAGPLVYVSLKALLWRRLRWKLGRAKVNWRLLFISAAVSLPVSLLFSQLSRLGTTRWIFDRQASLICWGCMTVVLYWALRTLNPRLRNLLFAMLLGTGVAAIWYIPNSYVFRIGWYRAYGEEAGVTVGTVLSTPEVWLTHIRELMIQQLSPPYFLMLLMALAILVLLHLRQKPLHRFDRLGDAAWLLGLWIVPPMVFFTIVEPAARNARLTTPYLPAVTLIMAQGVSKVPWRKVRLAALVILVAFGLVQFFVLSYDAFAGIPSRCEVSFPSIGPVGLFAQGEFIQLPNSGRTDDDYWVVDDIFDRVMADSSVSEGGQIKIGLLVGAPYLNGGQAQFVAASDYPALSVTDLKHDGGLPLYPRLFAMDYIVLIKSGSSTRDQARTLVETVKDPSDPFHKEFQWIDEFPFPDGDAAWLYGNKGYRVPGHIPESTLRFTHIDYVHQVNFGNQILFVGYTLKEEEAPRNKLVLEQLNLGADGEIAVADEEEASKGKLVLDLYWVCLEPMRQDYKVYLKLINGAYKIWGQQDGRPGGLPTNGWERGQSIRDHREIEILPGTLPGPYLVEVTLHDPYRQVYLRSEGESPLLLGPIVIPPRDPPSLESLDIEHPVKATLGGQARLLGYNIESGFRPGDNIHLTLFWQCLTEMEQDYNVFTHFVDYGGNIRAQKDNEPVDGFYSTTKWKVGEIVRDQYDLTIPLDAPPGEYQIEVGMYVAGTGERLTISDAGSGKEETRILLREIRIES
jgi:4-amino-4-deoxy-L-arabinose transferase-like glycosyltransferase